MSLVKLLVMPQMPKVELYAAIRRDHRGGMSTRGLERKHGVTWRTVGKALESSWPEPRKKLPPRATTLDPYKKERCGSPVPGAPWPRPCGWAAHAERR
ncbi:hypothetical protein M877_39205 (plasmid) [Streptomyces niveus NCIMB 11891]|nr:hypothetical protein M877_39205 [Streptomyces niveus NCIMB 11891]